MKTLKDAVYGFAVADALGVPYEFKERGTFNCVDMIGHGTWNQPIGTWSDDTSMLLVTCDSIRECKKINPEDMRRRFERWAFTGEYTANGDVFDIGGTTYQALRQKRGMNDLRANGNGSLMRILPLAFIESTDEEIFDVSVITHAHDISKEACLIYVAIAKQLIRGEDIKSILDGFKLYDDTVFERISSIADLPESEIKSTGYVVDSLEAALWCLCNTASFKECVLKAVNLGGDTDTIAAVAGGLAGIIYGYDSIPEDWIEKLKNKSLIDSCLFKSI